MEWVSILGYLWYNGFLVDPERMLMVTTTKEKTEGVVRKQVTSEECMKILREKKWSEKTIELLFRGGPPKKPIQIGKPEETGGGMILEIVN